LAKCSPPSSFPFPLHRRAGLFFLATGLQPKALAIFPPPFSRPRYSSMAYHLWFIIEATPGQTTDLQAAISSFFFFLSLSSPRLESVLPLVASFFNLSLHDSPSQPFSFRPCGNCATQSAPGSSGPSFLFFLRSPKMTLPFNIVMAHFLPPPPFLGPHQRGR